MALLQYRFICKNRSGAGLGPRAVLGLPLDSLEHQHSEITAGAPFSVFFITDQKQMPPLLLILCHSFLCHLRFILTLSLFNCIKHSHKTVQDSDVFIIFY